MDDPKTRREGKGKGKGPKEKKPYSAKHVRIMEAAKPPKPVKSEAANPFWLVTDSVLTKTSECRHC
jgi:hypothetical protein